MKKTLYEQKNKCDLKQFLKKHSRITIENVQLLTVHEIINAQLIFRSADLRKNTIVH